jgi:hypothetical protein
VAVLLAWFWGALKKYRDFLDFFSKKYLTKHNFFGIIAKRNTEG